MHPLFAPPLPMTRNQRTPSLSRRRPRLPNATPQHNPHCSIPATTPASKHPTASLSDPTSLRTFLETQWGKTPVLFRSLIPHDSLPSLTPQQLQSLATHASGPPSRLIHGDNTVANERDYTLQLGPFSARTFRELPATAWTLLLSDLDVHVPAVADALQPFFSFIPTHRRADIMASFAPPGGGVGPHVDNYDVFLVQAAGTRLWRTAYAPVPVGEERLVAGLDVRVLEGAFRHDEEWVLHPGDVLYVPPRIPHHGISLDGDCITYSVGCRAPSLGDMLTGWSERLVEVAALRERFIPDSITDIVHSVGDAGRVSDRVVDSAYEATLDAMKSNHELRQEFESWYMSQLSTRPGVEAVPAEGISETDVDDMLEELLASPRDVADAVAVDADADDSDGSDDGEGRTLVRQLDGAIFTYRETSYGVTMYVDGRQFPVENVTVARALCERRCAPASEFAELARVEPSVRDILKRMFMVGLLYLDEEGAAEDYYANIEDVEEEDNEDVALSADFVEAEAQ